jgi:hypothetical protein
MIKDQSGAREPRPLMSHVWAPRSEGSPPLGPENQGASTLRLAVFLDQAGCTPTRPATPRGTRDPVHAVRAIWKAVL